MHGRHRVSESEVVLAFLRGEVDSQRFGAGTRRALIDAGGMDLVRSPDLGSDEGNRARARALAAAHGWRTNTGLFTGFPDSVDWHHGVLDPDELARIRFIDYSYWVELSGGSRRPADVLPTLRGGELPAWLAELGTSWCFELAARLATETVMDDLIIMGHPDLDKLVVLEGHARLAAIFVGDLEQRIAVRAYLGLSPTIEQWTLY